MIRTFLLLTCVCASPAGAQDITMPVNAVQEFSEGKAPESFAIAIGAWDGTLPQIVVEGTVTKSVWHIPGAGLTTLQVLRPIRDQLNAAGFETLLECDAIGCGGFDFRFALDVINPPLMQVDLGDYRYLSATRQTDAGTGAVAILVSRTPQTGYVQITQITPEGATADAIVSGGEKLIATTVITPQSLADKLVTNGHAILYDLTFASGAAKLDDAPSESLQELANYLLVRPELTVALVGHTDAAGALDANIALSEQRATAVRNRLIERYNLPQNQIEAHGVGYLSPQTSNREPTGREINRRVEVVIAGASQ